MTLDVRRAADRFVTSRSGSETRYCFSFGHHYDPHNVAFGPVVAVNDEHLAPGAGFEPHQHAGLVIVTFVVAGSRTHQGVSDRTVDAGQVAVLRCGAGVTHAERNAGSTDLRFVQTWISTSEPAVGYDVTTGPVQVDSVTVTAGEIPSGSFTGHLLVTSGSVRVGDAELTDGDSLRTTSPVDLRVDRAIGVLVHL